MKYICFYILCLIVPAHFRAMAQDKTTYLIEAESFQFRGGWVVENVPGNQVSGNQIIRLFSSKGPAADALTVIQIAKAGNYTVWVNCPDYPADRPGTRLFKVAINAQELPPVGRHGKNGYYWEKAGVTSVDVGQNVLELKDIKGFGRCDAIILSSDTAFDPNKQGLATFQKFKATPVNVNALIKVPFSKTQIRLKSNTSSIASIAGENIRLRFERDTALPDKHLIAKTDIKKNGKWINMDPQAPDHRVYLISSDDPDLTFGTFFPSWNNTMGAGAIEVNGKTYKAVNSDNLLNPFFSGLVEEAIPFEANTVNEKAIEVNYRTQRGINIKGIWSLEKSDNHLSVQISCTAPKPGYYSFAVAAFQSLPFEKVTNVQMPPMFQYRRLSPQAKMLTSAMMPQPLAVVETDLSSGQFSYFAAPDPSAFPTTDWGTAKLAPYGFTLKNEFNAVQPVVFSPVLGLANSRFKAGATIEKRFVIGAVPAGWERAMEYISDHVYHVKDYREQKVSLSDAMFNMIDLMKNEDASGWNSKLKGFYDIEGDPKTAPTVVQCSPLTVLSAAVITRDEEFYLTRALPTIEYTLSRSGFRWATDIVPTAFNTTRKSLLLNPFPSQFTTAYYEGLYSLLGGANPWITQIAMPGNQVRKTNGYSVEVPAWTQILAAYRLTKDKQWLDSAKKGADGYIATHVKTNSLTPLSKGPFYNASFYANWWEFLDLYELTKENRYLKAAESSAFQTIVGIRNFPLVRDSLQTIHPGNQFENDAHIWWKENKLYRLGFPRVNGDAVQKQVPQSLVSPVGLGFEQPETYFDLVKTVKPVYMSSWAPNLLRLYQHTQKTIFNTYARNAVIGRFGNYPGYYAAGFTDIPLSKNYPYQGPDVSSIYYHHIPAHLSFTIDYLVSEAVTRSNGKVHFPYSKQDGFVWFDNRIYGMGTGTVYDDPEVQLWMKKDLIAVSNSEINYVTGISKDRFWILLSSESVKETALNITLSKETGVEMGAVAAIYQDGNIKNSAIKITGNKFDIPVKAKGFTAISFPLHHQVIKSDDIPVKNGIKIFDMGDPWGKIFTFRIRSPFGWDSIYGFAETAPINGASLDVFYNGKVITKSAYPFEWSIYRIDPKKEITLKIRVNNDHVTKEETITMEGAR